MAATVVELETGPNVLVARRLARRLGLWLTGIPVALMTVTRLPFACRLHRAHA